MPLEHNATVDDLVELTGKELKLTKLIVLNKVQPLQGVGNAPMHGRAVTLQLLGEGRVAGQGPVNRYSGDLHITDPGRCNWVGPLTGTRMAGSAKAMELEERFLSTLGAAAHLIRAGDGLRFETADKSGAVEFHLVQ